MSDDDPLRTLRILRGDPDPEELAALVAVLSRTTAARTASWPAPAPAPRRGRPLSRYHPPNSWRRAA